MNFKGNLFARATYYLWDIKQGGVRISERSILDAEQFLGDAEMQRLQLNRLRAIVEYAIANSTWYRDQFDKVGFSLKELRSLEDLVKIPVTTKQDIRNNLSQFISKEYDQSELVTAKTGGSTGVSLNLYFDRLCQKKRNAAQNMSDGWAGWRPGDQVAALWGNPPNPLSLKKKLRSKLLERMIYLDTMRLNPESIQAFYDECLAAAPQTLFGHAHSIYLFAKMCRELGLLGLTFEGVISTSMMLLKHERELIEQVFHVKVFNRYGCEEVGLIASECDQHDGMHINASHVLVECLDDEGNPVPYGEPGKIVVTDFNNRGMPLIRYRVEDVGVLTQEKCTCGRQTTLLKRLEGRVADFLIDTNGTLVGGVSLVERTLTKVSGVEQMQLVQQSRDEITVNRVKGADFSPHTDRLLLDELKASFTGPISFVLIDRKVIDQENNGKYRFSICKVNL